jgi:ABC-type polysaccharide/polyol phosphate export permease
MDETWLGRLRVDVGEMVREQFDYRELLYRLTARDLLLRYKQTAMGFAWAVFMPLVNTAIFSVIFTRVARVDTGGIPYPLYAFCGLLAWNLFAATLRTSVASLTTNVTLVTKVYFPREIFPFSALIVSLVDSAVASLVLVGLMAYYRVGVTPAVLLLPALVVVQGCFTAGVALVLAMANLFYRDVKYLFEVVIVAWMFATSVLYPVSLVGGRAGMLLRLNPMTPIVDAYRSVLLRGQLPPFGPYAAAAGVSVLVLVAAWTVFHRAEFTFAENI